ncbi:hypothetical protein NUW54_g8272 [Trametes sanguinea]|uniref:Uncharacterized protein n=1 Tax=Trametes sanguinea TaxID=158606 RepID=A0ACC1PG92_9APHY|nr:hypothetical protein NUW54_g8272 [Trametes sanguinea]
MVDMIPDSEAKGAFVRLTAPPSYSTLQQRVADAIRFGWSWQPGSPPGMYVDSEGRVRFYDGIGDTSVDLADTSTDVKSLSCPSFSIVPAHSSDTTYTTESARVPPSGVKGRPRDSPNVAGTTLVASREESFDHVQHDGSFAQIRRELQDIYDGTLPIDPENPSELRYTIVKVEDEQFNGKSLLLDEGRHFEVAPGRSMHVKPSHADGHIVYGFEGMKQTSVLLNRTKTRMWTLPKVYKWGTPNGIRQSWPSRISFWYRAMGVAVAGHEDVVLAKRVDGVPGLGPTSYQTAFHSLSRSADGSSVDAPSFAWALIDQLPPLDHNPKDPVEDTALVMYFILRPQLDGLSYFAWQVWPLADERRWSPKIYTMSNERWTLKVEEIRIWTSLTVQELGMVPGSFLKKEPVATIKCAAIFLIDTGAACSYFPKDMLELLIIKMKLKKDAGNNVLVPYSVPEPLPNEEDSYARGAIEWTFLSGGHTPVKAYTTLTRFLMNSNREGLIWPLPGVATGAPAQTGILGQNFFHAAHVAMHIPQLGGHPYVRITRHDSRQAEVPPDLISNKGKPSMAAPTPK